MKRYIKSATDSNKELAQRSTDPKELARFANDEDMWVKEAVAQNPNTPVEVLVQLANDKDIWARRTVAKNPNTPAKTLAQLANDPYTGVRHAVAQNPNTPADILVQFANSRDADARYYVTQNPNAPADVLAQLANSRDADVRYWIAKNPNTPAKTLAQLANDEDADVRDAATNNPNFPLKSKKSKKSDNWPSADVWYNIESDEGFEDMWDRYLAGPEDKINKQLQIFTEPSTQGGMGGMFIFDESGEGNESFSIDYQDWCDQEFNMAAESKNANEYQQKYKAFVEGLIDENWK